MLVFPKHVGEAELEHNDHLSSYHNVETEITENQWGHFNDENWAAPEEKQKAIATNELWSFWWYDEKGSERRGRHASTLDALMSSFGVDWKDAKFPDHKCSLHLTRVIDGSVSKKIDDQPDYYGDTDDWVSLEEMAQAISTNEMWTLHWYPDTPVGFCLRHGVNQNTLLASLIDS